MLLALAGLGFVDRQEGHGGCGDDGTRDALGGVDADPRHVDQRGIKSQLEHTRVRGGGGDQHLACAKNVLQRSLKIGPGKVYAGLHLDAYRPLAGRGRWLDLQHDQAAAGAQVEGLLKAPHELDIDRCGRDLARQARQVRDLQQFHGLGARTQELDREGLGSAAIAADFDRLGTGDDLQRGLDVGRRLHRIGRDRDGRGGAGGSAGGVGVGVVKLEAAAVGIGRQDQLLDRVALAALGDGADPNLVGAQVEQPRVADQAGRRKNILRARDVDRVDDGQLGQLQAHQRGECVRAQRVERAQAAAADQVAGKGGLAVQHEGVGIAAAVDRGVLVDIREDQLVVLGAGIDQAVDDVDAGAFEQQAGAGADLDHLQAGGCHGVQHLDLGVGVRCGEGGLELEGLDLVGRGVAVGLVEGDLERVRGAALDNLHVQRRTVRILGRGQRCLDVGRSDVVVGTDGDVEGHGGLGGLRQVGGHQCHRRRRRRRTLCGRRGGRGGGRAKRQVGDVALVREADLELAGLVSVGSHAYPVAARGQEAQSRLQCILDGEGHVPGLVRDFDLGRGQSLAGGRAGLVQLQREAAGLVALEVELEGVGVGVDEVEAARALRAQIDELL